MRTWWDVQPSWWTGTPSQLGNRRRCGRRRAMRLNAVEEGSVGVRRTGARKEIER